MNNTTNLSSLIWSHENITKRFQQMKKFLRGLLGETRNILDGGGTVLLSNLQYYENLKQALLELKKDPIYKIHYWDFTPYNSVTAERKRDEGEIYSPEIRRCFDVNDDIFCTDLIISLEHSTKNSHRELYIRKITWTSLIAPDYLVETQTPSEQRDASPKNFFLKTSGQYSFDKNIYYLVGTDGLRADYMQYDVFGYYNLIKEKFDRL